jgi:phosphatidylserine/phosphatidylglycerophosphate/cardiolipin synthase-like enzyme
MITLDKGMSLRSLLDRIRTQSDRTCTLYVIVPFIEIGTHSWRSTLLAAKAGARVRLITRSPTSLDLASEIRCLERLGGRLIIVENLHAKAIIWFGRSRRDKAAFIGSNNFTSSSENHSIELGMFVVGDGSAENLLYRDLKSFVENLASPCRARRAQCRSGRRELQWGPRTKT